ncbi:TetR/AcrR family transcriptional regulator [Thomasclavelia spiroformis]|uniref:TetR/AcrR family transcriptional regulator n=1 Tax=Thomasclavelia spiroformis TaxID=29348 RepID=UPI00241F2C1C|nr:TetR/AcrR family transcriptional regulator [Thomasclavelia spiroformis]MBS6115695.1 TetR/AcrR family transcriptional regulator [Thomasclavelia spiroformis]
MGKRQEAALQTRKKIIEVVKELLEEKKAEDINIEDITKRAHIAKGSFYTHFKRKEDVISEVALLEYDVVKDFVFQSSDNVYQQICSYLKKSVEIIEKNTLQVAQQWIKSVSAPLEEENSGVRKYQFDKENILNLLIQAQERHELNESMPVEVITEMIMDNYYGAVVTWCINKGKERTLVESIEHYCLYGLKPIIDIYKEEKL